MPSRLGTLKWVFLGLFATLSIAVTAYQWIYAIPHSKCEAAHGWWSPKEFKCYQPVRIVDLIAAGKALAPAEADKTATSSSASASR